MLISHKKHFIFTKTIKTAGTSVESYFEQYCMIDGEWQESHARNEYVSEAGIIGHRGKNRGESTWYNHMPAKRICDLIDKDIWDSYFKFTVIRNPFDKLISLFFFLMSRKNLIGDVGEGMEIEQFRCWVRGRGGVPDRNVYLIDGEECMDYFIRFEDLHEGMRYVCSSLSVPFESSRIPEFKKGIRHNRIKIQDYYDHETEQIVRNLYTWELERFGYDLPTETSLGA